MPELAFDAVPAFTMGRKGAELSAQGVKGQYG
jgi:hypothetical protein